MPYIFNLNSEIAVQNFKHWAIQAVAKKERIKVEKLKTKSLSQNAYIHLCFAWFGLQTGDTSAWVKEEIFKKIVNPTIFLVETPNRVTGEMRITWKSWADVTQEEANVAISRFLDYAIRDCKISMPLPDNKQDISYIQEEIMRNAEFL